MIGFTKVGQVILEASYCWGRSFSSMASLVVLDLEVRLVPAFSLVVLDLEPLVQVASKLVDADEASSKVDLQGD